MLVHLNTLTVIKNIRASSNLEGVNIPVLMVPKGDADALFEKDVDYLVVDNQVKIVDEQTGRVLDGRRYSDGLHQAIEAKENVKVEASTQTYATVTLQNFFRMYHKLAGMTGTAETEAGELWEIYKLDVIVIPTNKPIVRDDRNDLIYKTIRSKFNAVIEEIQKRTIPKYCSYSRFIDYRN